MRILRKTMTVVALAVALALATVGSAFAAETEETQVLDLDTLKANVIERIEARIEVFENRLHQLAGGDGPMAEQLQALFTEGGAVAEQLMADVQEANGAAEIHGLVREARGEFAAHARVRIAYAHVQNDLARFTHRVGLLEQETARAEAAGLETTRAAAQATVARADLAAVEAGLAGVDAGNTGPVVLAQIRAAHREAHSAQWHLRAGFGSLVDQAL